MQKINQLSKHMANLIAAGEVVERPASVVKELMENSIDAGATSVTVEITDGGITSISVTDNGSGIAHDDVETAFLRHATSKIRTEDDLAKIETMGFRGEALAAIAAVSRIALQTKTADETVGTGIELEGGVVTNLTDIGCPNGTKIMVCDLFFNTPARHKFLKKDSTEASYVQTVCQRVAMANPSIAIKFIKYGKIELHTPGDGNLYTVLYCLFGRETAQGLTEVRYERDPVGVYGYVSKPTMSRASRGMQYLFVNGRPVKNATMQAALEEAFRGKLVSGRFPYAFLNLTVPADSVDVNVHPAKTEVKFAAEKRVFEVIYYGIKAALEPAAAPTPVAVRAYEPVVAEPKPQVQTVLPTVVSELKALQSVSDVYKKHMNSTSRSDIITSEAEIITKPKEQTVVLRDPFAMQPIKVEDEEPIEPVAVASAVIPVKEEAVVFKPEPIAESAAENVQDEIETAVASEAKLPEYRLIGECFGVYILVEVEDKLCLIDKHAAHERIRYNELIAASEPLPAQLLLDAPVIALPADEKALLLAESEAISELGFELDDFGGSSVVVRALPTVYEAAEAAEAISELVERLAMKGGSVTEKRERLMRMIACKSAIRSGDHSDPAELAHLVELVFTDESVRFCPHGRPVLVEMQKKDLEKQFKRIVS